MSDHISPQAAAAREAARQASGEFGTQAHTPPERTEGVAAGTGAPGLVAIPGVPGGVDLHSDYRGQREWALSDTPPEVTCERGESGAVEVTLTWIDPDGDRCVYTEGFTDPERFDAYRTYTGGEYVGFDELPDETANRILDYAEPIMERAARFVPAVEHGMQGRRAAFDAVGRALDPRPWTAKELARNRADLHLDEVCESSADPGVTAALVRGLCDGGRLTDADVEALTREDVACLEADVAAAVDLFARERRAGR